MTRAPGRSRSVGVTMRGINPSLSTPVVLPGPASGWGLSLETLTPPEELYESIVCTRGHLPAGTAILSNVTWGFPPTITTGLAYPLGLPQLPYDGIRCGSLGGYGFEPSVSSTGRLGITAPNTTMVGAGTSVSHSAGTRRIDWVVQDLEMPQIADSVG